MYLNMIFDIIMLSRILDVCINFGSLLGEEVSCLIETSYTNLPFTYSTDTNVFSLRYIDMLSVSVIVGFCSVFHKNFTRFSDYSYSFFYTLCVIFSAIGLYSADSLVEFSLFWVFLNISIYGLILRNSGNTHATEAVVKYFLLGAVSTGFLFFGLFLNFALFQSLQFCEIRYLIETSVLLFGWEWSYLKAGAFLCVFIVFLFKLGAYPFHFYLPSLYEGVDYRALGVITIPVKWFTFLAMIKFITVYGSVSVTLVPFFIVLGFGSLFFGAYGLYAQNRLRSFWAYSYLGSLGFTFMGVSVSSLSVSWSSSIFYFIVYLFTWGIIYYLIGCLSTIVSYVPTLQYSNRSKKLWLLTWYSCTLPEIPVNEPRFLSDLSRSTQVLGSVKSRDLFLVCIFSLAGVPPAFGFIAKLAVLSTLVQTTFGFVICIFVVFTMIVSAAGYLRLVAALILVPNASSYDASLHTAEGTGFSDGGFSFLGKGEDYYGLDILLYILLFGGLFFLF